jgi:hypothetical protein
MVWLTCDGLMHKDEKAYDPMSARINEADTGESSREQNESQAAASDENRGAAQATQATFESPAEREPTTTQEAIPPEQDPSLVATWSEKLTQTLDDQDHKQKKDAADMKAAREKRLEEVATKVKAEMMPLVESVRYKQEPITAGNWEGTIWSDATNQSSKITIEVGAQLMEAKDGKSAGMEAKVAFPDGFGQSSCRQYTSKVVHRCTKRSVHIDLGDDSEDVKTMKDGVWYDKSERKMGTYSITFSSDSSSQTSQEMAGGGSDQKQGPDGEVVDEAEQCLIRMWQSRCIVRVALDKQPPTQMNVILRKLNDLNANPGRQLVSSFEEEPTTQGGTNTFLIHFNSRKPTMPDGENDLISQLSQASQFKQRVQVFQVLFEWSDTKALEAERVCRELGMENWTVVRRLTRDERKKHLKVENLREYTQGWAVDAMTPKLKKALGDFPALGNDSGTDAEQTPSQRQINRGWECLERKYQRDYNDYECASEQV